MREEDVGGSGVEMLEHWEALLMCAVVAESSTPAASTGHVTHLSLGLHLEADIPFDCCSLLLGKCSIHIKQQGITKM